MTAFFSRLGSVLSALRVWTVNILSLLVLLYIVGVIVYVFARMPDRVDPEGKVLVIAPKGTVLEQEVFPNKPSFLLGMPSTSQIQSRDLVKLIRGAAQDERLTGFLLDFSKTSFAGAATALRIAEELSALRESGKPVIAFSESLTTSSYLMAAQADEIYVHPSGAVAISGLGGYRDYTRELTDKLKVTMHNYSQGDFKSAVESRTRTDMSPADRLQREALYGPIWNSFKAAMGESRELDPELFQQLADNHPGLLAEAAYDNLAWAEREGVITGTLGFPAFRALMIEKFGRDEEDEERETYPHISWDAYLAQLPADESEAEDAVAVVFVEGGIRTGEIGPGVAGSHDVARLIRRAYESEDTRALVVRVNSPGGSVIASDIIRDELLAAKARDLPVVVSMGDVAASGGVWLSSPADRILAEPATITGSIGVAVAFPTLENVFDYVGVNFDGVTTSEHAGWGPHLGMNDKLDAIFARWAGSAYQRFIGVVAEGRDKEPDYIRSIAGGRVWLAEAAQERGLVDDIGSIDQALEAAAEMAGLEAYRVDYVTQQPSQAALLLQRFAIGALGVDGELGEHSFARRLARLMEELEGLTEPRATVLCAHCMIDLP